MTAGAPTARERLDRLQVWVYLIAAAAGLLAGSLAPGAWASAEVLVWPLLAALLFATFTQTPSSDIPRAFADRRFLVLAVVGNFVVMPGVAFGLTRFFEDGDPVQIGLLLVLLVPCTDWFITFAHLGRGDGARAAALTPLNLLLQLGLLPVYLWLMTDVQVLTVDSGPLAAAVAVVLVPLAAAFALERPLGRSDRGRAVRERLGLLPVPLLALVVLMVTAVHAPQVIGAADLLPAAAVVVVLFLGAALVAAALLGAAGRLPMRSRRTLAFSFSTRNSFLVLPVALALPAGWEIAP
ncbi:MAG: arsenic resistance protein, partial [Nesterenkonia sp.]|nr:arsenic resistance protein [Nesterenkonia sp.]